MLIFQNAAVFKLNKSQERIDTNCTFFIVNVTLIGQSSGKACAQLLLTQ